MSRSDKTYGPGELARAAGVSTDTLRHYERKGLLAPAHRTSSGYRRYPAAALARVELIQRTLVIGFSLSEVARVLAERERGGVPCRKVHALVGARLADLEARLKEMRALRHDLRRLVAEWSARLADTPPGTRAHLLDTLAGRRALGPLKSSKVQGFKSSRVQMFKSSKVQRFSRPKVQRPNS